MNILHSNESCEWYTPTTIIKYVHQTFLGDPELDPATSQEANQLIQAKHILTKKDQAHLTTTPWPKAKTIFLNPPSGRVGKDPLPRLFWERMLLENFEAAIVIVYSLEQLQNNQLILLHSSALCVPAKRIHFLQPKDAQTQGKIAHAPTHASAIALVSKDREIQHRFLQSFSVLGNTFVLVNYANTKG